MADFALEIESDIAREIQSNMILQSLNATFVSGGLGYVMNRFPPLLCYGRGTMFYSNVLPIILIFFVGMAEQIVLFAAVHKVR